MSVCFRSFLRKVVVLIFSRDRYFIRCGFRETVRIVVFVFFFVFVFCYFALRCDFYLCVLGSCLRLFLLF